MDATHATQELLEELTGHAPLDDGLAGLLDALPDGIVVTDLDGCIRRVSGRLCELSGHRAEDLIGKPVEALVPVDRRPRHRRLRDSFAADPYPRGMGAGLATDLRRRDGDVIPVDVALSPVTVAGETVVIASVRRATARREAEDLLREALERKTTAVETLRRADALKDTFLRTLSHDLRSPLATLLSTAMTLKDHAADLTQPEIDELLDVIVRGGERLDGLLGDLLDLDRMHRGGCGADRATLDVADLVRAQVEELSGHVQVELDAPESLTWSVDRAQLRRIVDNLVTNARKHALSDQPVEVHLRTDGDELHVVVEDRGPGVPDGQREEIFEPFARADSDAPGTGVGLSLVAEFARLHGGRAWVEDRPGGGASFWVAIPAEDVSASEG